MINKQNFKLSDELIHRPRLKRSDKYSAKELSQRLLGTTYNGYNNSIKPLLVIGLGVMACFKSEIFNEIHGFPVAYLYNGTSTGKSNVLDTVAYLFGFNRDFVIDGESTIKSMWQRLDDYYSIPVSYDEIPRDIIAKSEFEGLIKSAYECKSREKISKIKTTNINATLLMSSNYAPPQRPEILNRLLLCDFGQQKFDVETVKRFNGIREEYLSNLLPAILSYKSVKMLQLFYENKKYIRELDGSLQDRTISNIAVAYTGYQILLEIAEDTQPKKIEESFERFVKNYKQSQNIESPWDEFLKTLPLLADNKTIKYKRDFVYAEEKQESYRNGQKIINLVHSRLAIRSDKFYEAFVSHWRKTKKDAPLSRTELFAHAKNDPRVFLDKGQTTKTRNINGIKQRCIILDVRNDEELSTLDLR